LRRVEKKLHFSSVSAELSKNQYFYIICSWKTAKVSDCPVAYFEETFLLHVMRAQWKERINFALQQHYVIL